MNSQLICNLTQNLETIKSEIDKYSDMTRTEIFNQSINRLLKHTLQRYSNTIEQLSGYLLNQEGMRILKAITKIQKLDDKKIIYENMKGEINGEHNK